MDLVDRIVTFLVPLILSLSVHEYAHAQAAWWLGDDTAEREGRRTLNPINHIDVFGTLLFPILALAAPGGFLFGWARPVPVNPLMLSRRFSMKTGMMIVAIAGPVSNLLLAFLTVAGFRVMLFFDPSLITQKVALEILIGVTGLNLALCLFNLIPVYPLDGSRVLRGILPEGYTRWLDVMERNPMILIVAFVLVISYAGSILMYPIIFLFNLITTICGLPLQF
tara:strand:- start:178 stop:846 length:669 start_codon:yes stop_codon:yes gene_type:complete